MIPPSPSPWTRPAGIYVGGGTDSSYFHPYRAIQGGYGGADNNQCSDENCDAGDGFVDRVWAEEGTSLFSTYLGGSSENQVKQVMPQGGTLYVASTSTSSDFPGLRHPYKGSDPLPIFLSVIKSNRSRAAGER